MGDFAVAGLAWAPGGMRRRRQDGLGEWFFLILIFGDWEIKIKIKIKIKRKDGD